MKRIISLSISILCFFITMYSQADTLRADSLFESGVDLYYDGEYKKAKIDLYEALSIWEKITGEVHKKTMRIYMRLGKADRRLRYHQYAIDNLEKGLAIAKQVEGEYSDYVGGFYMELGTAYKQKFHVEKADFYNKKALEIFKKTKGEESLRVADMKMQMGLNMDKMRNFRAAEKYYLQALETYKKSAKPKSKYFNSLYLNMSSLYRHMGDYDKALQYGHKALEIKLLNYKPTHPSVSKYYYNLSKTYVDQGDYEKGLPFQKKSLELEELALDKDDPALGGSYGFLASYYAKMGKTEKAIELYWKSIGILEKRLRLTHPYVISGYDNIGSVYEDMEDYDQALSFYHQALARLNSDPSIPSSIKVISCRRIGNVFLKKNQLDSAFQYIGYALEGVAFDFEYDPTKNELNPSLEKIKSDLDYLDVLKVKRKIFEKAYESNNQITDLENGLKTVNITVALIDKMRRGYQSEGTRQFFSVEVASVFKAGVRISFQLWELTDDPAYLLQALQFSEKSKASILWENMNENFALENAGIPSEKLNELDLLNIQIREVEEQLFESKEADKEKIRNQVFDLKRSYETKIAELEKYNPSYFELKYTTPKLDVDNLYAKTKDGQTAIVEYFYDENNIYTFVITQGKLKGHRDSYSKKMDTIIQILRDFNIGKLPKNAQLQNQKYISHLNLLYKNLIMPIYNDISKAERLIFVPHGAMNYLSFEMLVPSNTEKDFRQLDYLLKRHHIQYVWSLALLEKKSTSNVNYKYDYLGFAPSFESAMLANSRTNSLSNHNNLPNLNFTKDEISMANNYFEGNIFLDKEASENYFQQYAHESQIIHLATHAIADDKEPMQSGLFFSNQKDTIEDGFLNAYEIYNMKLPADLAVMSACNTGFGQLAEGEGVISLGRAFSYAGCKSVMMSLWMANDQSTANLMNYFYQNLANGQRKDEALRNAKITYLENADPLTAHPYFWAGMVAVGDMSPLNSGGDNLMWWLGLGIVGMLLLFFFKKR